MTTTKILLVAGLSLTGCGSPQGPSSSPSSSSTTTSIATAQYRGSWQGATGQSLPIRFTVDQNNNVASLEVDYRISFPSAGTCMYTLRASNAPISNGQFDVTLISPTTLGFASTAIPRVRGTFTSATACSGAITDFCVGFFVCAGRVEAGGSFGVSGTSFSAQLISNPVLTER